MTPLQWVGHSIYVVCYVTGVLCYAAARIAVFFVALWVFGAAVDRLF